jgi:AcrR family transcriptional regulator
VSVPGSPIAPKPPRRRHHGDLRRALVLAGLEAIEELGVAALTIRGLARRLGVSHAAPAHHFPDKLALLSAVASEGFRRFETALREEARAGATPRQRMQRIGRAYVRFALDHPATFRVMFGRELADCSQATSELQQASASAYAVLQETAEAAAGSREAGEVHAFAGWALVHGAALLYLDGALRPRLPADSAGRAAFEELVDAVLSRGPPAVRRGSGGRAQKREAEANGPPPRRLARKRAS